MKYLTQLKSNMFIAFHFTEQEGQFDRQGRAGLPKGSPCTRTGEEWMEGTTRLSTLGSRELIGCLQVCHTGPFV